MTSWAKRPAALIVTGILLTIGCTADKPRNSDEDAAASVVERFVMEMFSVSGNAAIAFELIEPADRSNCDNKEFADIRNVGRTIVGGRSLTVDVHRVDLRGDEGTVTFSTELNGRAGLGLQPTAHVVRRDDEWYYRISAGHGCASASAFFGAQEVPLVTPETQGNPNCHLAYPLTCLPAPPPLLSCDDIKFPLIVVTEHPDPHGLDPDGDGFACG
jgi:hypothetical protein